MTGIVVHVNGFEGSAVDAGAVERAVRDTVESEDVHGGEFSVTRVNAVAMTDLNRRYLAREGVTDVIAFQLGDADGPLLGDVYVCEDVARRSAEEYGLPLDQELLRLVVHGVLHVLGYEHPEGEERDQSDMFRRQEAILARLT